MIHDINIYIGQKISHYSRAIQSLLQGLENKTIQWRVLCIFFSVQTKCEKPKKNRTHKSKREGEKRIRIKEHIADMNNGNRNSFSIEFYQMAVYKIG